jgi:hypothetical protein
VEPQLTQRKRGRQSNPRKASNGGPTKFIGSIYEYAETGVLRDLGGHVSESVPVESKARLVKANGRRRFAGRYFWGGCSGQHRSGRSTCLGGNKHDGQYLSKTVFLTI